MSKKTIPMSKKFLELQDLILIKTSLEKVRIHVSERKDKSVFPWIKRELATTIFKCFKFSELREISEKMRDAIEQEDYKGLEETLPTLIEKVERMIRDYYESM